VKIAIVSDFYLDYVGGAQTSIAEQKASLEAAGHTVLLVAAARGLKLTERDASGIRIKPSYTVPGVLLPVIKNRPALQASLRSFLIEEEIDIVHVQTEFGLAHAITTVAYELQLPVVHTVHTFYWQSHGLFPTIAEPLMRVLLTNITRAKIGDTPFSERPSDSLLRNLTLAMAKRADVVVSPSDHQGRDLAAAGVERPVAVVPNPIAGAATPAQHLDAVTEPRIAWIARCEPEKRPLAFVEAVIDAMSRTDVPFSVDVVGGGSQLEQVKSLAAQHPQIRVHGGLPHDRVIELIDASSLVALTSLGFDNQPMTVAEAVSRYRGVLFCDEKLREGLGESGYLTPSADVAGISRAIVDLVTKPGRLEELSAGAVTDATTFAGATFVERILDVYTRAATEAH
jgi:glycosyltransferase involved in cell wall biosynthesis